MKTVIENYPAEVYISAVEQKRANLNEWERLELHLLAALGTACEKCDGYQVELLCDLMKGKNGPQVTIPAHVLEESGFDTDCKLVCTADPESGEAHVAEADHRYDLTDLPAELLDTFRESGICLGDLEAKLMEEEPVYGKES